MFPVDERAQSGKEVPKVNCGLAIEDWMWHIEDWMQYIEEHTIARGTISGENILALCS